MKGAKRSHSRGTICPSSAMHHPRKNGGRRDAGFGAPAAARALVESTRVSHYRFAETVRHSLRNGLAAYT
jgi:hypothetical protein